jgi:hypothetical protein
VHQSLRLAERPVRLLTRAPVGAEGDATREEGRGKVRLRASKLPSPGGAGLLRTGTSTGAPGT